jgi:hypothetical protein
MLAELFGVALPVAALKPGCKYHHGPAYEREDQVRNKESGNTVHASLPVHKPLRCGTAEGYTRNLLARIEFIFIRKIREECRRADMACGVF